MVPSDRSVRCYQRLFALLVGVGVVLLFAEATHAGEGGEVNLWPYIKPTGLVTLSLLIAAACLAAFRKARPRLMLKLHKISAALTVISALCHATLVFLSG